MASVYKRKSRYAVIYYQIDRSGERKQKWESFKTEELARRRKYAIEHPLLFCEQPAPILTVNDLMKQFFELYGTVRWTYSTAANYESLRCRFIEPLFGECGISELTGQHVATIYSRLIKGYKSCPPICKSTLRDLNKLLKCAFHQAIIWNVIERSPFQSIIIPKDTVKRKPSWSSEEVWQAVQNCNDVPLSLAIQLAFVCSLRKGEILALQWNNINLELGTIQVNKTMQRISRSTLSLLGMKDVIEILPNDDVSPTVLIIKTPKTESSVRTVFIPDQFAEQFRAFKATTQPNEHDFVFQIKNGKPLQPEYLRKRFDALIEATGLPKVTFHSLRHSSVTYKLVLTNGNIKAVQGDTGHAQAGMVLEVYAEILDSERKNTANLIQHNWYDENS